MTEGKSKSPVLLIEPCGIEISNKSSFSMPSANLLIEPCGIEISNGRRGSLGRLLLIEPCGIEICVNINRLTFNHVTFNRTLWN